MNNDTEFPGLFTEEMLEFRTFIRGFLMRKYETESPTIAFCYAWTDPKDEENIGRFIGDVPLANCNIQGILLKIKHILEKIGFIVRIDKHNNDHGRKKLKKQLKKRIKKSDVRICFLTPLFKEKCLRINKDTGKPYVIAKEVKMINKLNVKTHPTFRFIMVGDEKNAVPKRWLSFLRTPQSHKTFLEALEFIIQKLCLDSDAPDSSDENLIFKKQWDRFIAGKSNLSSTELKEPAVSPAQETQAKEIYAASPGRFFSRKTGTVAESLENTTINMIENSESITGEERDFLPVAISNAQAGDVVTFSAGAIIKGKGVGLTINM